MRDAMQQVDNSLLTPVPKHSRHNLSSQTLTTMKIGELCPIFCQETVPGGTYNLSNETLVRFQPLVSPVMHRMQMKTHYFYVPNRIIWDNWQHFISGRPDPLTGLDPVHPYFLRSSMNINPNNGTTNPRLAGYFGMSASDPNVISEDIKLNPIAMAAYQMIYNWYYRHKTVQPEVKYKLKDGDVYDPFSGVGHELFNLRKITFSDDYFNSCLPTPQAGTPAFIDADAQLFHDTSDKILDNINVRGVLPNPNDNVDPNAYFARTRIIVEEIRRATKLQKFLELDRHTLTYMDYLKGHFNVDFPDYRAQIPEYITGFAQNIVVSDVVNQADLNQGRITGIANGFAQSPTKSFHAHEHGLIIGIAAVTYDSNYVDAMPKIHTKQSRFDYFIPMFDSLGEQIVKKVELHSQARQPEQPFGYVPRHFEYRSAFNMVTDEMKTSYLHWHLARKFGLTPRLTRDFYEVPDDRRIFAFQDPDDSPIIVQAHTSVSALMPMGDIAIPSIG